jgi:hypothetical protein
MRTAIRRDSGLVFLAVLLAGCAAPVQRISNTPSGKPEVVIAAELTAIKGAIIADRVNHGYQIEKDTDYLLELARPTKDNEDIAAYFLVGNAYSTNHRVVAYTFVKTPEGVRVIGSPTIRAQLPGGQINSADLSNNGNVYNTFQTHLFEVKTVVERQGAK